MQHLRQGIVATIPLAVAVLPWGILTGALAIQTGFSFWAAQLMSLLVFAGAAQLSAMTLMAGGAGAPAVMSSVFVISSRHLLYSIVFRQHVLQLPWRWRVALAFVLTDEMFAISEAHTREHSEFSPVFALASGLTFYVVWNFATLLGIVAGDAMSNLDQLGLDFAIVATFVAMTFSDLFKRPVLVAVLVSGALAVVLQHWLAESYIIVAALAGMVSAYCVDVILGCDND